MGLYLVVQHGVDERLKQIQILENYQYDYCLSFLQLFQKYWNLVNDELIIIDIIVTTPLYTKYQSRPGERD